MAVRSFVGRDGSARIWVDGSEVKLREATVDAARARVLDHAREHAAATQIAQTLTAADVDGEWQMVILPTGEVLPVTTARVPAPVPPAPPMPVGAPAVVLRIDMTDGSFTRATAPIVIGRRPDPAAGHELVTLLSPHREVSRSHLVARVEDGLIVLTDLGSANGTYVNGRQLPPRTPVVVESGTIVDVGDVTIRIGIER